MHLPLFSLAYPTAYMSFNDRGMPMSNKIAFVMSEYKIIFPKSFENEKKQLRQ